MPESTAEKLAEQFDVSKNTIKRDAEFARAVNTIAGNVGTEARDAIHALPGAYPRPLQSLQATLTRPDITLTEAILVARGCTASPPASGGGFFMRLELIALSMQGA